MILALVIAMYEAAILKGRRHGALDPRLFILLDEAANIAPVRNLAPWLYRCGGHGIVIATIWQSIAQIDQRYGRAARDAICAASTAPVFIPPLAEPTSAGYLTELLGEEPVANASSTTQRHTMSVGNQKAGPAPWLRQIGPDARSSSTGIYRPRSYVRLDGLRTRGSPTECVRDVVSRRPVRPELNCPGPARYFRSWSATRRSVGFRVPLHSKSSRNSCVVYPCCNSSQAATWSPTTTASASAVEAGAVPCFPRVAGAAPAMFKCSSQQESRARRRSARPGGRRSHGLES
jgi:hypothetical protein